MLAALSVPILHLDCPRAKRMHPLPFVVPMSLTSFKPADARGAERAVREVDSLRAYAFRALRFLFSMERNRKVRVPSCLAHCFGWKGQEFLKVGQRSH
jgi:hypothetical protein